MQLNRKYKSIANQSGLKADYTKTNVVGFKDAKVSKLTDAENDDKIKLDQKVNDIRAYIKSDTVSKTINTEKQNRHIRGSDDYVVGRSYIHGTCETAQELVDAYHGTGLPQFTRKGEWNKKEVASADHEIGINVDEDTGVELSTNRFVIHYSKTGTHIVPTKKKE